MAKKKVCWVLILTPGGDERNGRATAKKLSDEDLAAGTYALGWNWGGGGNDVFLCELPEDHAAPAEEVERLALDAIGTGVANG